MPDNTNGSHEARERALRMLALQIVAQLPEDQGEANRVLLLATTVLNEFLHDEQAPQRKPLRCVT